MRTLLILFLLFIVRVDFVFGQEDLPSYLNISHYAVKEPLINALAIDSQNNVWVATEKGISRSENGQLVYIQDAKIQNKEINAICIDAHNTRWFGTYKGELISFKGKDLVEVIPLNELHTNNTKIKKHHKDTSMVKGIAEWVATNQLFLAMESGYLIEIQANNPTKNKKILDIIPYTPTCIYFQKNENRLWIGTTNGLYLKNMEQDDSKLELKRKNIQVNAIHDFNGEVYFLSTEKEGAFFGKITSNLQIESIPITGDPLSEWRKFTFMDFAVDKNATFYFAANGIICYNENWKIPKWHYHHSENSNSNFDSKYPLCIAVDEEQNIWVGTEGKGLLVGRHTEGPIPDSNTNATRVVNVDTIKPSHTPPYTTATTDTNKINQVPKQGSKGDSIKKPPTVAKVETAVNTQKIKAGCNSPIKSGGFGKTIIEMDMGLEKKGFVLSYNMFELPDKLSIYCGEKQIFTTGWVKQSNQAYIPYECRNITIIVEGRDKSTSWSFKAGCPE